MISVVVLEYNTALLLMATLAKYLAASSANPTDLGTDERAYEKAAFHPSKPKKPIECLGVRFNNVLPVPTTAVDIKQIIAFKKKRRAELLAFRRELKRFHDEVGKCNDRVALKEVQIEFKERIENGVMTLDRLMREAKFSTYFGGWEAIQKASVPAALSAGMSWFAGILPSPQIKLLAMAGAASIGIAKHIIDQRARLKKTLGDSPFSFIFEARREGLVA